MARRISLESRTFSRTSLFALAGALSVLFWTASSASAQCAGTLVVTNTADSGLGSLRDAINLANCVGGTSTITFNIPGAGVHTIFLQSELPPLEESLLVPASITIDGYSQPGSSPNTLPNGDNAVLRIQIDGSIIDSLFNSSGITIVGSNCVIKGLVISNFTGPGIFDASGEYGPGNAVIQGNFIGTTPSGMAAAGNGSTGVDTFDSGPVIGGTDPAARNIISGNASDGVSTRLSGGIIQGNFIGTDATGLGNLGNAGAGVRISEESNNVVGGIAPGAANVIAFNAGEGVILRCSEGCPTGSGILGNSIFSNGSFGISLGASPVPNDPCDGDSGPNNLQNYPVLTRAEVQGDSTLIEGTLGSASDATYRVELFASPACDPSGFGEGRTFLGATNLSLGSCNGSFSLTIPQALVAGQVVTATATDQSNNTSEFSACRAVTNGICLQSPPPPHLIIDFPIAPEGVVATLTWDAPSFDFAGTYTILFSTDNGATFSLFAELVTGNQYAFIVRFPVGTTVVFEVLADPGCGPAGISDPSPIASLQVVQACPKAADPVALLDQSQVAVGENWSLHWTATLPVVSGVTAGVYQVFISRDNGVSYQLAGSTTATSFTGPVLPGDLGKLIFLQVIAKPSCDTGTLSDGHSNVVFFTGLPGAACAAPGGPTGLSIAAFGVTPPRPPSPTEYFVVSWSLPAVGTLPTHYSVQINGDPAVLTTATSLIFSPRGSSSPITVSVTAHACGTLNSAEVFVPGSGTWSPTGALGIPRESHTASVLPGGKVLVAGGISTPFGPAIGSAELFDPGTGVWTPTGPLATARQFHTATVLPSGKVLVSGGVSGGLAAASLIHLESTDNLQEAGLSSAELYDPAAGTWAGTGDLATARTLHTATLLLTGKVLVVGGRGSAGALDTTELYDPLTGHWSASGKLGTPRLAHTATLLPNGKVLVAGGLDAPGVLGSVEIYDPAAGTWTSTGSLGTAREWHTATVLGSGLVLVAGGDSGGVASKSGELYSPAAGTWSATGSLGTARTRHTATLLPSGAVLVAGGNALLGPSLKSTELYDPAAGTWSPTTGNLNGAHGLNTATPISSGNVLLAGLFDSFGPDQAGPSANLTSALFLTPPVANFTISASPRVGQPVTFTDTSNPQATSWLWLFDDGTQQTVQSPAKTYTTVGTHTVALIATNGAGSSSKVQSFLVSAASATVQLPQTTETVSFTEGQTGRRSASVDLSGGVTVWLQLVSAAKTDSTLFLRFLDARGNVVVERRLFVGAGTAVANDLGAYGLEGSYALELVGESSVTATILRVGRGTREVRR